jgi:hypothetical protein
MTNDISHDSFEATDNSISDVVAASISTAPDIDHVEKLKCEKGVDDEVDATTRRLLISDYMIIIAGIAITIATATLTKSELHEVFKGYYITGWPTLHRIRFAQFAMIALIPLTIVLLILRLKLPSQELKRVIYRPGTIATWSASFTILFHALSLPMDQHTMGAFGSPMLVVVFYWPTAIFSVVFASWTILIFSGNWKPGDDMLDRLGILVGMCWIGLFPILNLIEFVLY